jgi:transposase-like protein
VREDWSYLDVDQAGRPKPEHLRPSREYRNRLTDEVEKGARTAIAAAKPRGRRPLPDRTLAELAIRYCELPGRDRIKALAREVGLSPSTVSGRIREARERGLLTGTERGRAGGMPTPRAIELVEGH